MQLGLSLSLTALRAAGAGAAALLPLNTPYVEVGNSKQAAGFSASESDYFQMLTGGRFYRSPWSRLSKGGDTVADYVNATRLTLLTAICKDALVSFGDATNGADIAYATQLADYRAGATHALANGAAAVMIDLTPYTTAMSAPVKANIDSLNAAIIAMAAEPGWNGKLHYADLRSIDRADASVSYDGTHNTAKGAIQVATIKAALAMTLIDSASIFPAGDLAATPDGRFGANLNSLYAMADGNADGTADSHTLAGASGATATASFVTEGRRKQRIAYSGTATTNTVSNTFTRTVTSLSLVPGAVVEMIVPFEISDAANTGDPAGMAGAQLTIGSAFTAFGVAIQSQNGPLRKVSGPIRIAGVVTAGSGVATLTSLALATAVRHNVGAVDGAIRVGDQWFLRVAEQIAYAAPVNMGVTWNRSSDGASSNFFVMPTATNSAGTVNASPGNVAGGGLTLTYQWERDTGSGYADISGATSRFYVTGGATGSYRCKITYTNSYGSITVTTTVVTQ